MMISDLFGNLSQLFWICAQLPQIWTNYSNRSVEGLSLPFLLNWLAGDITNLIGCLFTDQLSFQRNLAVYFNCIDLILIAQFALYSRRPLPPVLKTDGIQINTEEFLAVPEQAFHHSSSNDSLNKFRSSGCSRSSLNHSIADETSKTACPLLEPSFPDSGSFTPSVSAHNPSNTPTPDLHSITLIQAPHFTLASAIRCNLKIITFLTIFGVSIFSLQNLVPIHSITSPYTQPLPSPTTSTNKSMSSNLSADWAQDPIFPVVPTPSNILTRFTEGRSVADLMSSSGTNRKRKQTRSITQQIGRLSAWLCAFLYLTSRCPQIYKNHSRKSVEGLSILLFILAFLGNLTYVSSILTSSKILGGGDSKDTKLGYLSESIPYLIGSAGTLCFDFTIFIQSWIYRARGPPALRSYRRLSTSSESSESSTCSRIAHL